MHRLQVEAEYSLDDIVNIVAHRASDEAREDYDVAVLDADDNAPQPACSLAKAREHLAAIELFVSELAEFAGDEQLQLQELSNKLSQLIVSRVLKRQHIKIAQFFSCQS